MQLIWVVLTFPLEIIMNASKSILGFVLKKRGSKARPGPAELSLWLVYTHHMFSITDTNAISLLIAHFLIEEDFDR